ncbi:MAG: aldehyde dehydrogenase family protein [Halomonas sp.]|uniref:aldehyde dehydrogenase family protein n=1 Tax=Halomonas sp. TaxID=1486246 RepID=UPI002ACE70AC|nr:aldehyde dehydrogenase family protein [Halomonas sp.]MDZ7854534.1 aldehyde dehydrogenase family protein [Halomonas sp.]
MPASIRWYSPALSRTGQDIMRNAASNLKRLTLELGGNDAAIVLPDAPVEAIAESIFQTAFLNMGQTCAALKRLYVHDSLYALAEQRTGQARPRPEGRRRYGSGRHLRPDPEPRPVPVGVRTGGRRPCPGGAGAGRR